MTFKPCAVCGKDHDTERHPKELMGFRFPETTRAIRIRGRSNGGKTRAANMRIDRALREIRSARP